MFWIWCIRRKPDIKLGKDKGDSERLSTIQLAILEKSHRY